LIKVLPESTTAAARLAIFAIVEIYESLAGENENRKNRKPDPKSTCLKNA
jgi:hypothetical protein